MGFEFVLETLEMFRFFIGFFISSISKRRFLKEKQKSNNSKMKTFSFLSFYLIVVSFCSKSFENFPIGFSFVRFHVDFLL